MRIAFMGTPAFAVGVLSDLIAAGHEVAAVYTQPPKPRGRGQQLMPSPVGAFAVERGLDVRTPKSMRDPAEIAAFEALGLDTAVVVAFGQILPRAVLDAPRLGAFNLHGSLLPRWRGAAPIQRAIMAGDRETGVQVMRMSEGLDEGPILLTAKTLIEADDTAQSLFARLAALGGPLTVQALALLARGEATETPQDAVGVTYAKKITTEEARIDWTRPAAEVDCAIRGLSPFPGAWFMVEGPRGPVRVKALMSRPSLGEGRPGEALDDGLKIACGSGAVRLLKLQREGKGPQDAEDFLRGLPVADGVVLA